MTFRLRDACRDLVRRPGPATVVVFGALVLVLSPIIYTSLATSRSIAGAGDGRVAFNAFYPWAAFAIVFGGFAARAAAALIASPMIARAGFEESSARALLHGIPALLAAALAYALTGLGVIAGLVAAYPLAATTFVAAPAAAVEQLAPVDAMRRSAALTRGARLRFGLLLAAMIAIQSLPMILARAIWVKGKKPPVAPILHMQQLTGVLVIAAVVITALVQVHAYRRLVGSTDPERA